MRIDLHTHSTASDGTSSPAALVAEARAAGLDVVGLTDHDTTAGWAEASAVAAGHGITLVVGTEVSTRHGSASVHLLSYLQDPAEPVLAARLARTRTDRDDRARRIVERLAVDHPITWDEVAAQAVDARTVGRPHIADALVAAGVVSDRSAAFGELLAEAGPYYVPYDAPTTCAAVAMIVHAGGVPVLAHPGAVGRGQILPDEMFDELADAGLVGIEVHHRDHSAAQVDRLTRIAARLGLLVTGSSDYHGTGKPNRLGEHLTDPEVFARIVAQGTTPVVRP